MGQSAGSGCRCASRSSSRGCPRAAAGGRRCQGHRDAALHSCVVPCAEVAGWSAIHASAFSLAVIALHDAVVCRMQDGMPFMQAFYCRDGALHSCVVPCAGLGWSAAHASAFSLNGLVGRGRQSSPFMMSSSAVCKM